MSFQGIENCMVGDTSAWVCESMVCVCVCGMFIDTAHYIWRVYGVFFQAKLKPQYIYMACVSELQLMLTFVQSTIELASTWFSTYSWIENAPHSVPVIPHVHKPNLIVSTWFGTYSWIVSTPHSVPVYNSRT